MWHAVLALALLATTTACPGRSEVRVGHAQPAPPPPGPCTDIPACLHQGEEHEEAGDVAGAARFWDHGCDRLADPASCLLVGRLRRDHGPTDADRARADARFRRACDLGEPDGCSEAGLRAIQGGQAGQLAPGVALFRRACDGGSGLGCHNLAVLHLDGTGVPRDPAIAAALFERGCARGHASACLELGRRKLLADGLPEDRAGAVTALHTACSLAARTCDGLATAHEYVLGVPEDAARARALYDQACGAGRPEACLALGDMLGEGRGGPADAARAKVLYEGACAAGVDEACDMLRAR